MAFFAGWSSIGFWVACQAPQLIQNCKRKSVDAISVWFLLQWFLGDILNLIGCFLSRQVTTVKAVAILYVSLDSIISAQYIYYRCFGPNSNRGKGKGKESLLLKDQLADDDDTNSIASNMTPDLGNYQPPKISSAGVKETDRSATNSESRQVHGFILPVLIGLQFFMSCSLGYHLASQQESAVTPAHRVKVWERRVLSLDATTEHATHTHPSELGSFQDFWKSLQLHEPLMFWLGWGIGWVCSHSQKHLLPHIYAHIHEAAYVYPPVYTSTYI